MRSNKVEVSEKSIQETTEKMKSSFVLKSIKDPLAQADVSKDLRDKECLCKNCYYFSKHKISLKAFFNQECGLCGKDQRYSSSKTDALCKECATQNDLCKHCGGKKEF